MSIIREFTLYLHAGITTPEVIHANQYSQGETWIFKLLQDDGSAYVPSTGALIGVKADGHAIAGLTGTVLGDGRVSITTTQQLTAAAGDATCELTIDGGTNGSANFVIRVEKKPTDDAILSESDLSIIQEGLNSVTPAAIEEKVSDWLEENFTDPPVDPTLSISNAAADAKSTGDAISDLKNAITKLNAFSFAEQSLIADTALTYYPAAIPQGSILTIKNVSGQNFSTDWGLILYASDKTTVLTTITLSTSQSERSLTVTQEGVAYVRPNYVFADDAEITWSVEGFNAKQRITDNEGDVALLQNQIENIQAVIPQPYNLFDKTAITEGKHVNPSNGTLNNGYNCTDYIPVKAGVTYYAGVIYHNGYCALYDKNKQYLSAVTQIQDDASGTWHFTPAQDGYFRGTLTGLTWKDIAYVSTENVFREYTGIIDFSKASQLHSEEIQNRAVGGETTNLFKGGSNYYSYNSSTGELLYGVVYRVMTPLIKVSVEFYWYAKTDLSGIVGYVLEYDSSKTFIRATLTNGKTIGSFKLHTDTQYIRLNTITLTQETCPKPSEYDEMLYVTDSLEKLNKYISSHSIVTAESTGYDFYNHSVVFKHDYVKSAIETYQNTINNGGYDFVMPMNTDIHNIDSEPYNMLTYMAETGVADVCFNLGDNIVDHFDDGDDAVDFHKAIALWSRSPFAKCPQIVLRGNHDNNPVTGNDKTEMISNAEYYALYHERTIKGFAGTNKNYGFIDFEQSKIRVIFLDSGDIYKDNGDPLTTGYNVAVRQAQMDWFCNTALNFTDKADRAEWAVITVSHAQLKQLNEQAFNDVLYAFLHGSTASGTVTQTFDDTGETNTVTYNVDFTAQGAMEYICHFNGHNHYDDAFLMGNTNRYDIDICSDLNNGGARVNGVTQPYTYTSGTINERCMDTCCIKKSNRTIYMKRLGVGTDRTFIY